MLDRQEEFEELKKLYTEVRTSQSRVVGGSGEVKNHRNNDTTLEATMLMGESAHNAVITELKKQL